MTPAHAQVGKEEDRGAVVDVGISAALALRKRRLFDQVSLAESLRPICSTTLRS